MRSSLRGRTAGVLLLFFPRQAGLANPKIEGHNSMSQVERIHRRASGRKEELWSQGLFCRLPMPMISANSGSLRSMGNADLARSTPLPGKARRIVHLGVLPVLNLAHYLAHFV